MPRSLFPARNPRELTDRIDWWIEHPHERAKWAYRYANHTKRHYSAKASVTAFVRMEREAIAT